MKESILVAGGAGRLGSRLSELLALKDYQVICFDSLVTGDGNRAVHGPLVKADVRETPRLVRSMKEYAVKRVFHCALRTDSPDVEPGLIYEQHLASVLSLVQALRESGATSLTVLANPGRTTDMIERILKDCASAYGLELRLLVALSPEEALSGAIATLR